MIYIIVSHKEEQLWRLEGLLTIAGLQREKYNKLLDFIFCINDNIKDLYAADYRVKNKFI